MTEAFAVPATDAADLRIRSIRTSILDIPLVRPHRVAVATLETQPILLVRVLLANGVEGIGEGVTPGGPWWGGESVEGMQALVDRHLAPMLLGQDAGRIDQLLQQMNRSVAGANFAKAAVDMALWDALGKSYGLPVHKLLGGAHRDRLPVAWALGADPIPVVVREIEETRASRGHKRFKLKMGKMEPAEDVARVATIIRSAPSGVGFAVDLNGAWDQPTARRWAPALEDAGVDMIEQPLPRWNLDAMAQLRQASRARIMADESLLTVQDAVAIARAGAADVFAQKLAKSGGISAVQRIGVIAEACGIAGYAGTTIETSIGTAASLHAFCAQASLTAGSELFGPLLLADDLVENPVVYADGDVHLNDGPGLGVVLNEQKVRKYTRG